MVGGALLRNLHIADARWWGLSTQRSGFPECGALPPLFRPPRVGSSRLSGCKQLPTFGAACIETGRDPAWFTGAEAVGPSAMFSRAEKAVRTSAPRGGRTPW